MNRENIEQWTREAGGFDATPEFLERFAKLVAQHERKEMQAKIETLYAMYELVSKQRDYLMDEQRAQVAAMRGRIQ